MSFRDKLLRKQYKLLELGLKSNELELIDEENNWLKKLKITEELFQCITYELENNLDYYALEQGYVDFWFEFIPNHGYVSSHNCNEQLDEMEEYINNIDLKNNLDDLLDIEFLRMFCRNKGVMFVQIDKYTEDDIHYYRYYFRFNLSKMYNKVRVKKMVNSNSCY